MEVKLGINKEQAEKLIDKYITDSITKLHLIETEAIMRKLAKRFGEDEEQWGLIGLLHDIDWDISKNSDISQHTIRAVNILKDGADGFADLFANELKGPHQRMARSQRPGRNTQRIDQLPFKQIGPFGYS